MAKRKKARRTVLYSSKGKKLYAKRNADGTFNDIQSYKRCSQLDQKKSSKAERAKRDRRPKCGCGKCACSKSRSKHCTCKVS